MKGEGEGRVSGLDPLTGSPPLPGSGWQLNSLCLNKKKPSWENTAREQG